MKFDGSHWQVVIIVFALGFGAIASRSALQSPRPSMPMLRAKVAIGDQRVSSRLWEDPLVAVTGEEKDVPSGPPKPPSGPSPVLVMPVVVPGGPYVVDSEQRTRMRYAVAMALLDEEFQPRNPEHLGRWSVPEGPQSQSWTTVAFEWWSRSVEHAHQEVLVIWLSEDDVFASEPGRQNRWSSLVEGLVRTGFHGVRLSALGPSSSDGLRAIASDLPRLAEEWTGGCSSDSAFGRWVQDSWAKSGLGWTPIFRRESFVKRGEDVQFLSPSATIADEKLGVTIPPALVRTIATDRDMADVLVRELIARRAINPCPTPGERAGSIVLLSEYDTEYGRQWPEAFRAAVDGATKGSECAGPATDTYFYLRGLDGIKGGGQAPGSASNPAKAEATLSEATIQSLNKLLDSGVAPERPFGSSQFDYVRRLARQIETTYTAANPITAIGICGTDTFDKLLLLQAMRDVFPGIVFFTTDLDASLLMPDQYRWTRNLVVASSYDFQLGRSLQHHAPPFRDCYQTSLFHAVKLALDPDAGRDIGVGEFGPPRPPRSSPHVFEIGRSGAWDLDRPAGGASPSPYFPDRALLTTSLVRKTWPLSLGGAGILVLLLYTRQNSLLALPRVLSPTTHGVAGGRWARARRWVFGTEIGRLVWLLLVWSTIAATIATVIIWLAHRLSNDPAPEPIALFEGISAWPTEIIRLLIAAMSLGWIVVLMRRWGRAKRSIATMFAAPPPRPSDPRAFQLWRLSRRTSPASLQQAAARFSRLLVVAYARVFIRTLRHPLLPLRIALARHSVVGWTQPDGPVDFSVLWLEYRRRARHIRRIVRAGLLTIAYLIAGGLLFAALFMPLKPLRGNTIAMVDGVALWSAVIATTFLNFLVWDATRLCTRFIRLLIDANHRTTYSTRMLNACPGLFPASAPSVLDVRIVAEVTDEVGRAVYYPVLMLFLLLVARSQLFDNWHLGLPLVIVIGVSFLITTLAGYSLRSAAEECRRIERRRLTGLRVAAPSTSGKHPAAVAIDAAIAEIDGIRRGAFAAFRDNPILNSLLVPASGAVALLLIDHLSNRPW